jgi:hypothetical protein
VVALAVISVPLTARSLDAASSSRQREQVADIVADWLGPADLEVTELEVAAQRVTVELSGLGEPPPAYELATRLTPVLGERAEAVVRWDQRSQGVAQAGMPPPADPDDVAHDVIATWVEGLAVEGYVFDVLGVAVEGQTVHVDLSGPVAPPPSATLADDVAAALGTGVDVSVRWLQSFDPGLNGELPVARLERLTRAWIGPRAGVRLIGAAISGDLATVDLATDGTPLGVTRLRTLLIEHIEAVERVEVRTLDLAVAAVVDDEFPAPQLD